MTEKELDEKRKNSRERVHQWRLKRGDIRTDEEIFAATQKGLYYTKEEANNVIENLMAGPKIIITERDTCHLSSITREEMIEYVNNEQL